MTSASAGSASTAPEIVLLTRAGCSACGKAQAVLTELLGGYGLSLHLRDVDRLAEEGDTFTRAEYGDRLPVILLDGAEHSYWEVDVPRLRADIDARRDR